MPLHKAIKRKWLAAIESGEYKQGKIYLKYTAATGESQYCCLGVLADVCGAVPRVIVRDHLPDGGATVWSFLNRKENDLVGARFDNSYWGTDAGLTVEQVKKLSNMNDGGKSFKEIADYIRDNIGPK